MSERLVGVVGVGGFGRHHARIYSSLPSCHLVGIFDIDRNRAAETAVRFQTRAFPTLEELLDNVEAVSIVVPTVRHAEAAAEALKRGVHTLVEKPIADSLPQADAILSAAAASGAFLAVGQLERFNPAFKTAVGGFTGLKFFRAERLGPWVGTNIDVDIVVDLMVHDIDLLVSLDTSPPSEVKATGTAVLSDLPDIVNARITLESGAVAIIDASRISPGKHRMVRLYSDSEYLSIDMLNRRARRLCLKAGEEPSLDRVEIPVPEKEPLFEELKAFLESLDGATTPIATGVEARKTLSIALSVSEALKDKL